MPTLRIWREPGQYCVSLQDHEMCQQCGAVSTTLEGLWDALEAALRSPMPWKAYKSPLNRKGEPFSQKKKTGQGK